MRIVLHGMRGLGKWTARSLAALVVLGSPGTAWGGETHRVSTSAEGIAGDRDSFGPVLSANGRFVAFESYATNLIGGDANGVWDVFVYDRKADRIERISTDSRGSEGDLNSLQPSLSARGRFVAFASYATNLVPGEPELLAGVFVRDRRTGTTARVSVDSQGIPANLDSLRPSLSGQGRFVAFESLATNLVAGDGNRSIDIFVHDRRQGTTERASVSSAGVEANGRSQAAKLSGRGRFVAFASSATNLVPGDTNGSWDVFVRDRRTQTTERVSVGPGGVEADGGSYQPSLSADARFVAFESDATNLVAGDDNFLTDVFVHDRRTGRTKRVSVDPAGSEAGDGSFQASMSADGRFVTFVSYAPGETPQIFRYDRENRRTTLVSVDSLGSEADDASFQPSCSGDGRLVTFASRATHLVSRDAIGISQVYLHDRR